MTEQSKIFAFPTKQDPFKIKHKDFKLSAKIPSKYITLNIFGYAFLKETAYRAITGLCYDSFCFLREQRPQFHRVCNGLGDLELDEIEDNLGRD